MNILVVSQYFWPENFRINDLCEELVKRGHNVTVLTGKPNYPSGDLFPEFKQSSKEFNEYKGCEIVRVPITMRGQDSGRKLVINYLSYILSASILGLWKIRQRNFDVVFVYEPSPVTVCLPAILYKKITGTPIVFWVLDLWPETLEAIGAVKSPRIISIVGRLVKFIYNRCDLVLGQSKAFFKGIARYCDNPHKIRYFPSWSEAIFSKNKPVTLADVLVNEPCFKIVFAGNIGEAQDFPSILKALKVLKENKISAKLFVLGDGRAFEGVKADIFKYELEGYVEMLGRYPLEKMPEFYMSADALLVTLKESEVFSMTIPGKVQSYMSAGKPILSMLSGEGSRVIDEANCGLTAQSGDYEKLAQNIIQLTNSSSETLSQMGNNARIYAKQEFDRDQLISKLEAWFEELANAKDYHQ